MNARKDRVLGRGLSALISGAEQPQRTDEAGGRLGDREARMISLELIGLNPNQPRKIFKDNALNELADSVRQVGVLQPVLVRELVEGEPAPVRLDERMELGGEPGPDPKYSLVAGERRVRAARMAGVEEIPAIVCSYEETEALKVALLENIQRENLNPVEEALAYDRLLDSYGATQEELAVMLGKSRSGVANTLRLLSLEQEIQEMLQDEQITRGHAKVLLGVTDSSSRLRLARMCRSRGLSVRDCEKRVQAMLTGRTGEASAPRRRKAAAGETREVRALRERAEEALGTPVQIERDAEGKGSLNLKFYSDDDLMGLLQRLGVDTDLS